MTWAESNRTLRVNLAAECNNPYGNAIGTELARWSLSFRRYDETFVMRPVSPTDGRRWRFGFLLKRIACFKRIAPTEGPGLGSSVLQPGSVADPNHRLAGIVDQHGTIIHVDVGILRVIRHRIDVQFRPDLIADAHVAIVLDRLDLVLAHKVPVARADGRTGAGTDNAADRCTHGAGDEVAGRGSH